jgi:V/A-type H+-transporting ATPase subunit I
VAIQEILKTYIFCPSSRKEKTLKKLQLWGRMELISIRDKDESIDEIPLTDNSLQLGFMVEFLAKYKQKESAWKKLKEGLPEIDAERLAHIEESIDINADYDRLRELDKSIKDAKSSITENYRKIAELEIVKDITVSGNDIELKKVGVIIGKIEKNLQSRLDDQEEIYYELLIDSEHPVFALYYLKKNEESVKKICHELNVHKIDLPEKISPGEKIESLRNDISELKHKIQSFNDDVVAEFIGKISEYEILLDVHENKRALSEERAKTGSTKYLSIISGWIPGYLKDEFVELLSKTCPHAHYEFLEPHKNERPPVLLKNDSFTDSFEIVTDLYGTPDYKWVDPTPFVAPFFAFFFGLCLTDAGYGLILGALCMWAIKKLKLTKGVRRFMLLLFWGSAASVVTGALTGGWFGNVFSGIEIFNKIKILDPLEKPQYFLYFSVLLGYIHVILGILISLTKNVSMGNIKTAIYEELPWVVILAAIPVCFIPGIENVGKIAILTGLVWVVLFSGHANKNIVGRIATGLYGVYGGTDYFKDMISYSRLFALGMGTAILGMAVNEMSVQASALPVIGYALMIVVFIGGHIFNIVMSVLSAYIHTSRLQYVEFFTKFFKGGGSSFSPFAWKHKRVKFVTD